MLDRSSLIPTAIAACLLALVPTSATPQAIRKEAGLMVPMRDGVRLSTD